MALITFDDKDNSLPTSNPRRLFRDVDANEIKTVVNANQNALPAAIAAGKIPFGTTSGTNTITATMSPTVTAYAETDLYRLQVTNSTTGLATINLDGVGEKKAYLTPDTQLSIGDVVGGHNYLFTYRTSLDGGAGGFLFVGDYNHQSMSYRGGFNASGGAFPSTGGTGTGGAIRTFDTWAISVGGTLGGIAVSSKDFIIAIGDNPTNVLSDWLIIYGHPSMDTKLALKQTLINSAVVLTDAASIDLTAIKHTLTTASSRTFTISYTGDDITMEVTLNAASATQTFPVGSLCVSEGVASGDNTCGLSGTSGDKYIITIKKIGSAYYVVAKNFDQ